MPPCVSEAVQLGREIGYGGQTESESALSPNIWLLVSPFRTALTYCINNSSEVALKVEGEEEEKKSKAKKIGKGIKL